MQVSLQKASLRTTMLLFTKTKISFSLNWSKVKSQDHSVQVMVQLFWVVCWELMTSGYSLAYKATEKDNFLKNMSRNLWSKSNFLAEHLPQSSQILHSPSEAYQKRTAQRGAQSYCSCSQTEMAARSRLLSEHQPIFCLVCFSVLELFWGRGQVEAGQTPSCSPLQEYETSLWNTVLCMCTRSDSTARKGCSICPFSAITGTLHYTPAGKAGGHPHQPKSKPVVIIQLWKFPWEQKHGFFLSSSSFTSTNLSA